MADNGGLLPWKIQEIFLGGPLADNRNLNKKPLPPTGQKWQQQDPSTKECKLVPVQTSTTTTTGTLETSHRGESDYAAHEKQATKETHHDHPYDEVVVVVEEDDSACSGSLVDVKERFDAADDGDDWEDGDDDWEQVQGCDSSVRSFSSSHDTGHSNLGGGGGGGEGSSTTRGDNKIQKSHSSSTIDSDDVVTIIVAYCCVKMIFHVDEATTTS